MLGPLARSTTRLFSTRWSTAVAGCPRPLLSGGELQVRSARWLAVPLVSLALLSSGRRRRVGDELQVAGFFPSQGVEDIFRNSERLRRRAMVYLYSPKKLMKLLSLLEDIDSPKTQLHVASSLSFLSKDPEAALQMGYSGTFEALWQLSHLSSDHLSKKQQLALLHHLVATMENLVSVVPRWARRVRDSLELLSLLRMWAEVEETQEDTTLALLRIFLVLSKSAAAHEPAAADSAAPAAAAEAGDGQHQLGVELAESPQFKAVRRDMEEARAKLDAGRHSAERLLLSSLQAVHYKLLLLHDGDEKLLGQALELELDVLCNVATELRQRAADDEAQQETFVREALRLIRDTMQPGFAAAHTPSFHVKTARILSALAADELGRYEISQPHNGWLPVLATWARSPDPQLRLHTAHALAHLMENDEIGTYVIQQLGFELIASLADIADIDVQNTVTRMFARLRTVSAAEFDSLAGCIKDFTIDDDWKVYESNTTPAKQASNVA